MEIKTDELLQSIKDVDGTSKVNLVSIENKNNLVVCNLQRSLKMNMFNQTIDYIKENMR